LVTATGAALGALPDKAGLRTVAGAGLAPSVLRWPALLMLSTRELGELPLVVWLIRHRQHRRDDEQPLANLPGKLTTVLQFGAVAAALLRAPEAERWLVAAAASGVLAAVSYWQRAIFHERARHDDVGR
jgi:hypothetical protein